MALNIEFEGWVNEIKDWSWGKTLKMTHQQRGKNAETGVWETVGKDYIDVSVSYDSDVEIPESKLVRVFGTFKIETYTKNDGTVAVAIKVRASKLEAVERDLPPVTTWNAPLSAQPVVELDDTPF